VINAYIPDASVADVTLNLHATAFAEMPVRTPRLDRSARAGSTDDDTSDDEHLRSVSPPPARRPLREFYLADEMPTVYARALEMQGPDAPWDYTSARRALEAAIDAESVPGGRFLPVAFTYPKMGGRGTTFRILLMSEESIVPGATGVGEHQTHTGTARHINDYCIPEEAALMYLTYDYLAHRTRQEGIGLRGLIGTPAFNDRIVVVDRHANTYRQGRFEAYDTILSYMLK
jgi:hypothetical protein